VPFKSRSQKEIDRLNRLQRERFDELVERFEPPLPEKVPERLERIVAAAGIKKGQTVLDVGAGTGILVPRIRPYRPGRIIACDLSQKMLERLHENHPDVETVHCDVRDLALPEGGIDVVFINACYPNIADKAGAFSNLFRLMTPGGRLVVSHPLGRRFVEALKQSAPFPLDSLPVEPEALRLLSPIGFAIRSLLDEPELYVLVAEKPG
jgi:SAM-dependent methyltransferase